MADFIFIIVNGLLLFFEIVVFAWVISTWLIQFNVINTRNPTVNALTRMLWMCSRPLLRPVQRVIPPIGGSIDISPLIVLLVLQAARVALLPWLLTRLQGVGL